MRTFGIALIIIIIAAILIIPRVFSSLNSQDPKPEKANTATASRDTSKNARLRRLPGAGGSMQHGGGQASSSDDGTTLYAPGYSAKDFEGDAYKAPDDPAANMPKQSAGGLWETLLKLKFNNKYDKNTGETSSLPIFTPQIIALDGREITIKGHFIPMQSDDGAMMLSAYPVSSCFYCGGAGPESIMEVYPKGKIAFTEAMVTVKGTLKLNYNDPLRFSYLLEKAVLVN